MGNPDTKRNGDRPLDLIWGAEAIAEEINRKPRNVYHIHRTRLLGDAITKVGDRLVADRVTLIRRFRPPA